MQRPCAFIVSPAAACIRRGLIMCSSFLFTVSFVQGIAFAQPPAAPPPAVEDPAQAVNPLLLQPPKNKEEVDARIALAQERIAALKAALPPAPETPDETVSSRRDVMTALIQEWETYLVELNRILSIQDAIAALSSQQRTQELSQKIEDIKARTEQLRKLPRPFSATDEQVAEITARHQEFEGQLTALSELQTRRASQLATGFKQQRDTLEAQLKELRQKRQALQAPPPEGAAPVEKEIRDLQRRRFDVQIARAELALHALRLESEQTELAVKQDAQYLEVLREYVVGLRQRMASLTEARSRSTLEVIELKRQAAATPAEIAYLDLQYFRETVLLNYFKNRKLLNALKDRFPASALDRLRDRVTLRSAMWDEMLDSLRQRTGQEAMGLRRQMRDDRVAYQQELEVLRNRLGETLAELQQLQTVRERATQRFRELAEKLTAAVEGLDPAERTRLETETTSLRASLQEGMKQTITEAQEVVTRIKEGIQLLRDFVAKLQQLEDEAYWTAVARRESGLAGLEWAAVREEFRQLVHGPDQPPTAAPRPTGPAAVAALFPERRQVREELAAEISTVIDDLRRVPAYAWIVLAAAVATAIGLSWIVRRAARRRASSLAFALSESVDADGRWIDGSRHLSDQMDLFGWRLTERAWVPVLLAAVLCAFVGLTPLSPLTRSLLLAMIGLLFGGYVLSVFIRVLFPAGDARQRVVPCPDHVAAHYRRWLTATVLFAVLALLPVTVLIIFDTAPALRTLFWELFKIGLLVLLLGFLAPKHRVLGISGRRPRHWTFSIVSVLCPLILLGVAALLVLQIIGYGVLVEFVGAGLLVSLAALAVIAVGVEYVCDLLDRYPGVSEVPRVPPAAARARNESDDADDSEHGLEAEREPPPTLHDVGHIAAFLRLLKALLRLGAVALAVVVVLRVWGLTTYQQAMDWSLVGLGTVVIVAAVIVDRVVFTALQTLYTSQRIPASTANIIRRWVRGLLSLVVVLILIAMTGYQIDNLWTLVTTLLAMIAIGFVAVWSVLSNIMSTLIILIWKPFNVGEYIEIQPEGIKGEVIDINFMYTLLRTETGVRTTVPNSQFLQKFIRRKPLRKKPKRTLAEQLAAAEPLHE